MIENIRKMIAGIAGGITGGISGGPAGAHIVRDENISGVSAAYDIPRESFAKAAKGMKAEGFRLVAEWAVDETLFKRGFSVLAAYNNGPVFIVLKSDLPAADPSFPTLTRHYTAAYRFERQIRSLMGVVPAGHPDPRPWIKHEDWPEDAYPLRKTFDGKGALPRVEGTYPFARAEGEGVYEIPVGPVHAGIIEPGHFRFQAVGEDIINLEKKLGYVHKGIEKRFETLSWKDAVRLAGRVSGDTTVAHSIAFSSAAEAASGTVPPERAMWMRALFLELERVANHLGDIGAISNDTAFTFLLYQLAILREKVLRASKEVFGHRLLMDLVVPGGVATGITREGSGVISSLLDEVSREFEKLVIIYEDNPSLEDRTHGTGILEPDTARELGVVGFVARSSGQWIDSRVQRPHPPYDTLKPRVPLLSSGDVHARTWVRVEEVRESIRLIRGILNGMPDGPLAADLRPPAPGASGFSAVEGWRGEIVYWVHSGPDGGINRCMVRDPSSVNWLAIERAIKGNIVPDFPLCNKSFNQSYSGNDL